MKQRQWEEASKLLLGHTNTSDDERIFILFMGWHRQRIRKTVAQLARVAMRTTALSEVSMDEALWAVL